MSEDEEIMYEGEPHDPQNVMFWDCEKVLRAGIWLIRNGYGKLAILPYFSPSGCYWRCEFHPIGQSKKAFFRYSTGSAGKFLLGHCGGSVRRNISPKGLAQAIMVSVSDDLKQRCVGDVSRQMDDWLVSLERALDEGLIPQAFEEYSDDPDWKLFSFNGNLGSSMLPQPGYVLPGTEPSWNQETFWRSCAEWGDALREKGSFAIEYAMVEKAVTEEVATEVYRAMLDAEGYEAQHILQMAINAVLYRISAIPKKEKSN